MITDINSKFDLERFIVSLKKTILKLVVITKEPTNIMYHLLYCIQNCT